MKQVYIELMSYLSRTRRVEIAATECRTIPNVYADILSVETKGVYEYEIKVSYNDIHNDKKKDKHTIYGRFDKYKRSLPQYFVMVLPVEVVQTYMQCLEDGHFNPKYGVLSYDKDYNFKYVKGPYRLNKGLAGYLRTEIQRRSLDDFRGIFDYIDKIKQTENLEIVENWKLLNININGLKIAGIVGEEMRKIMTDQLHRITKLRIEEIKDGQTSTIAGV